MNPNEIIWGIDLGTHYGWAVWWGGMIWSGHEQFKTSRHPHPGERYILMTDSLNSLRDRWGLPTCVFYERVVGQLHSAQQAHVYGAFLGMLQSWMWLQCPTVRLQGVAVSTLKKWAVGNGRAVKSAMVKRLNDQGYRVEDDNEADAIWCLRYGLWTLHNEGEQQHG